RFFFFFQAEDGIRDFHVTGVQTCALPISDDNADLRATARELGREYVIKVKGTVIERSSKNLKIPTGEVEIKVTDLVVLNSSKVPPFSIEDETDGGEELRLKYRYLDLRSNLVRDNIII